MVQANYTFFSYGVNRSEMAQMEAEQYTVEFWEMVGMMNVSNNRAEVFLNTTDLISSNLSEVWQWCGESIYTLKQETEDYLRIFDRIRHVYSYSASVLQAMLSNLVQLSTLNDRLVVALEQGNSLEIAWLSGRVLRVLFVVQPLRVIDDYDYNEDDDDFNRRLRADLTEIWIGVTDIFLGFTDSVLGNLTNS